jgi:hypothetical protein
VTVCGPPCSLVGFERIMGIEVQIAIGGGVELSGLLTHEHHNTLCHLINLSKTYFSHGITPNFVRAGSPMYPFRAAVRVSIPQRLLCGFPALKSTSTEAKLCAALRRVQGRDTEVRRKWGRCTLTCGRTPGPRAEFLNFECRAC